MSTADYKFPASFTLSSHVVVKFELTTNNTADCESPVSASGFLHSQFLPNSLEKHCACSLFVHQLFVKMVNRGRGGAMAGSRGGHSHAPKPGPSGMQDIRKNFQASAQKASRKGRDKVRGPGFIPLLEKLR